MPGPEDYSSRIVTREHRDGTRYGVEVVVPRYCRRSRWLLFGAEVRVYQEPDVYYGRYNSRGFPYADWGDGDCFWGTRLDAEHLQRLIDDLRPQHDATPAPGY